MCGRFTSHLSPELLEALFGIPAPSELKPRYNIAPTQPVMIVRQQLDGKRELSYVNWGLIPSWSKDPSIAQSLINARSETVAEKPSFRSAYRHRRCIVPGNGYFEWQKTGEKSKQPWYITSTDGSPFSFAGLWEHWQSPDGSEIESCCILTTAANELTQPIHDRMPVILPPGSFTKWLSAASNQNELQKLLVPYPSTAMDCYRVSPLVNNPRNDSLDCIDPNDKVQHGM